MTKFTRSLKRIQRIARSLMEPATCPHLSYDEDGNCTLGCKL